MNPKVMDAVGFIGRYVAENWESLVDQEDIADELINMGFSTREISDAFKWIERNTLGDSAAIEAAAGGPAEEKQPSGPEIRPPTRILSAMEQSKIDHEAYAVLMTYYNRGLLDPVLLEEVIERALRSESDEVGDREMRRITALTLFNRVQAEWREFLHTTNTLVH